MRAATWLGFRRHLTWPPPGGSLARTPCALPDTRRGLSPHRILARCRSREAFQGVSEATGRVVFWRVCPPWCWRRVALQRISEAGRRVALVVACDGRGCGLALQQGVDEALADLCPGLLPRMRRPGGALVPGRGLRKDLDLLQGDLACGAWRIAHRIAPRGELQHTAQPLVERDIRELHAHRVLRARAHANGDAGLLVNLGQHLPKTRLP